MNILDIRAELSMKMLELETAIDTGMPYSDLKNIYCKIKELQYQLAFAEVKNSTAAAQDKDVVIE